MKHPVVADPKKHSKIREIIYQQRQAENRGFTHQTGEKYIYMHNIVMYSVDRQKLTFFQLFDSPGGTINR